MDDLASTDNLEKLLNYLTDVEEKQYKLYDVYRRAADADEEMRTLKSKEKIVRGLIAIKVNRS